jgi:hypothetical protein
MKNNTRDRTIDQNRSKNPRESIVSVSSAVDLAAWNSL